MAKFRKAADEVEAVQWFQHSRRPYPMWLIEAVQNGRIRLGAEGQFYLKPTQDEASAELPLADGDFIIKGDQGELSLSKPDVFTAAYEAVKDGA